MNKRRNLVVEEHYRENYSILIKRMRFKVGGNQQVAEDVVQEAYSRAIKYFKRFNPSRGDFGQWFSTVLNNSLNDMKKFERSMGVVHELDAVEDYQMVSEELTVLPVEQEERFRIGLSKAISEERFRDRIILTMFFFDGFKSREVAEFLNLNHNTVRQVINRFREKMVALPDGVI